MSKATSIQVNNSATDYLTMMSEFSSNEDAVELLAYYIQDIVDGGIMHETDTDNQRIVISALACVMKSVVEQYLKAKKSLDCLAHGLPNPK